MLQGWEEAPSLQRSASRHQQIKLQHDAQLVYVWLNDTVRDEHKREQHMVLGWCDCAKISYQSAEP